MIVYERQVHCFSLSRLSSQASEGMGRGAANAGGSWLEQLAAEAER